MYSNILYKERELENMPPDALSKIRGITIVNGTNRIKKSTFTSDDGTSEILSDISVPWKTSSAAFQMIIPDATIDISKMETGWREFLLQFSTHIKSLNILVPIDDLSFIDSFSALKDLTLIGSNCSNWDFFSSLPHLHMLVISGCNSFETSALGLIADTQASFPYTDRFPSKLNYVCIEKCGISDISVFRKFKYFSELDLSDNLIEDVSALSSLFISDLTLKNNKITDVSPLYNTDYLLDISYNEVSELPAWFSSSGIRRLFIDHNKITDFHRIYEMNLRETDFVDYWEKRDKW